MMKQLLPFLFLTIFLGILTGANIYLSQRFSWYFSFPHTWLLNIVFAVVTLYMMFGVFVFSNSVTLSGHVLYIGAAMLMGILLYLLLSVLMVDLLRLFTSFQPPVYGFVVIVLTTVVSLTGTLHSWNTKVTQKNIPIKELAHPVRAMHLSDIHLGHFRGTRFLKKLVKKTNAENPDVVFITGDLFDGRYRLNKEDLQPMTQFNAPVFFIEGNHDNYTGIKTIKQLLRELGIRVLENEIEAFKGLHIIGLNHMTADEKSISRHASGRNGTIKSTLKNLAPDPSNPSVLLHHSPDGIQYASEYGVDLYLSGHTHAGQLFPVKYIADMMFQFNRGMHRYNGTTMFVSQGAGTFGPPMRLGTISEITLLNLNPE